MSVKSGAAQFTQITIDEIESYLQRGFRALRPKKGLERGEVIFDLRLSDQVGVRVWTSVHEGKEHGASVGTDAIRVQFFNFRRNRPLKPGKAPIVKRTQNWRDNLRERIEDYIELYDKVENDLESGKFIDWTQIAV